MSCLSITELPLSEQIEIELVLAARSLERYRALLTSLDPAVYPSLDSPCSVGEPVGSIFLSTAERQAMVERQYRQHPALAACGCTRSPRMYEARGNGHTVYYAECSFCGVRASKLPDPANAAAAWNQGERSPIQHKAVA